MKFAVPRCGVELSVDEQRYASCIHEAGRVVSAYYLGAWLDSDGIQVAGHRNGQATIHWGADHRSWRNELLNTLCAPLAERRWLRSAQVLSTLDIAFQRQPALTNSTIDRPNEDVQSLTNAISLERPRLTLKEKSRLAARLQGEANNIVCDPPVWEAIIALADALWEKQILEAETVEQIISRSLFESMGEQGTSALTEFHERFYITSSAAAIHRRSARSEAALRRPHANC